MRASNTMRWPSGAQRGVPVVLPMEVICTGFEPSALQIQISGRPERLDAKTIFFPSGEYRGLFSCRVEAISLTGFPNGDKSKRQMLSSEKRRLYARRRPSR